ncbi:MAG: hypothetical protein Q8L06_11260 [Pseudohongiella sp.]|nr:hypothetical protein [Pseudohongiella sp.]
MSKGDYSSYDAYLVLRKMLGSGHPFNNWDQLLAECMLMDFIV